MPEEEREVQPPYDEGNVTVDHGLAIYVGMFLGWLLLANLGF